MKAIVAALVLATTVLAAHPAEARQAPVLTVMSLTDPADPQVVPAGGSEGEGIGFTVTSSEAASVTATASGTGLTVSDANQVLAVTAGHADYFTVHVMASTPGFHALTLTVSATGATPQQVTLPYIWADGSPAFPSTGSLAGRTYGWQGGINVAGLESSIRDTEMLSFVSPTLAYDGLPPAGQPKCVTPGKGCVPYAYDASTGLVQVGDHIVGRVVGDALRTDGFTPADDSVPELFAHEYLTDPLLFAKAGSRYQGHWVYADGSYPSGLVYESVAFRKDGTYALAFAVDNGNTRHLSGTYQIGKRGKITFRSKGKVAQIGTLAAVGGTLDKPRPVKLGFWLILSGLKGNRTDGNLLERDKKKQK